jgi:hypothetical protein
MALENLYEASGVLKMALEKLCYTKWRETKVYLETAETSKLEND